MRLLADHLRARGQRVIETAEPGGTAVGAQIRRILLDPANAGLCPVTELLLYFASRAQNVNQTIVPALEAGAIVLCDRFTDSTLAYQGCGRGLGTDSVLELDRIACRGLRPDLTILIDIDPETSLARARARNLFDDRMDDQPVEFHKKVRDAYLAMAAEEPDRFRVIDGRAGPEVVAARVRDAVIPYV